MNVFIYILFYIYLASVCQIQVKMVRLSIFTALNLQEIEKKFRIEKHSDRETIDRFDCNRCLKIKLHNSFEQGVTQICSQNLHERFDVTEEMKLTIRQQLHLSPKDIIPILHKKKYTIGGRNRFKLYTKRIMTSYCQLKCCWKSSLRYPFV